MNDDQESWPHGNMIDPDRATLGPSNRARLRLCINQAAVTDRLVAPQVTFYTLLRPRHWLYLRKA